MCVFMMVDCQLTKETACIDLSPAGITIKNRPKNNSQFCMRRSSADGVRKRTNKDMITNRNVLRKY
jgi:hypothetical protein